MDDSGGSSIEDSETGNEDSEEIMKELNKFLDPKWKSQRKQLFSPSEKHQLVRKSMILRACKNHQRNIISSTPHHTQERPSLKDFSIILSPVVKNSLEDDVITVSDVVEEVGPKNVIIHSNVAVKSNDNHKEPIQTKKNDKKNTCASKEVNKKPILNKNKSTENIHISDNSEVKKYNVRNVSRNIKENKVDKVNKKTSAKKNPKNKKVIHRSPNKNTKLDITAKNNNANNITLPEKNTSTHNKILRVNLSSVKTTKNNNASNITLPEKNTSTRNKLLHVDLSSFKTTKNNNASNIKLPNSTEKNTSTNNASNIKLPESTESNTSPNISLHENLKLAESNNASNTKLPGTAEPNITTYHKSEISRLDVCNTGSNREFNKTVESNTLAHSRSLCEHIRLDKVAKSNNVNDVNIPETAKEIVIDKVHEKVQCLKSIAIMEVGTSPINFEDDASRQKPENFSEMKKVTNAFSQKKKELFLDKVHKKVQCPKSVAMIEAGTSPMHFENDTSQQKPENISEMTKLINELSEKKTEFLRRTVNREVQTSASNMFKTPQKHSFLSPNINKLVEQETQTTNSLNKPIRTYVNKSKSQRFYNKESFPSDESESGESCFSDIVLVTKSFLPNESQSHPLYKSLIEGYEFSDEIEECPEDVERTVWRLDEGLVNNPRRSSVKLNFLKNSAEIEKSYLKQNVSKKNAINSSVGYNPKSNFGQNDSTADSFTTKVKAIEQISLSNKNRKGKPSKTVFPLNSVAEELKSASSYKKKTSSPNISQKPLQDKNTVSISSNISEISNKQNGTKKSENQKNINISKEMNSPKASKGKLKEIITSTSSKSAKPLETHTNFCEVQEAEVVDRVIPQSKSAKQKDLPKAVVSSTTTELQEILQGRPQRIRRPPQRKCSHSLISKQFMENIETTTTNRKKREGKRMTTEDTEQIKRKRGRKPKESNNEINIRKNQNEIIDTVSSTEYIETEDKARNDTEQNRFLGTNNKNEQMETDPEIFKKPAKRRGRPRKKINVPQNKLNEEVGPLNHIDHLQEIKENVNNKRAYSYGHNEIEENMCSNNNNEEIELEPAIIEEPIQKKKGRQIQPEKKTNDHQNSHSGVVRVLTYSDDVSSEMNIEPSALNKENILCGNSDDKETDIEPAVIVKTVKRRRGRPKQSEKNTQKDNLVGTNIDRHTRDEIHTKDIQSEKPIKRARGRPKQVKKNTMSDLNDDPAVLGSLLPTDTEGQVNNVCNEMDSNNQFIYTNNNFNNKTKLKSGATSTEKPNSTSEISNFSNVRHEVFSDRDEVFPETSMATNTKIQLAISSINHEQRETFKDSGNYTCSERHKGSSSNEKDNLTRPLTGMIKKSKEKNSANKLKSVLGKSRSYLRASSISEACSTHDGVNSTRNETMINPTINTCINCLCGDEKVTYKFSSKNPTNFSFKSDTIHVEKCLKDPTGTCSTGYIKILPNKKKEPHICKNHIMAFSVLSGKGAVECHNKLDHVQDRDGFLIPRGIKYSIKNLSQDNSLLLSYCKFDNSNKLV